MQEIKLYKIRKGQIKFVKSVEKEIVTVNSYEIKTSDKKNKRRV